MGVFHVRPDRYDDGSGTDDPYFQYIEGNKRLGKT
jgi:hypothetical protein